MGPGALVAGRFSIEQPATAGGMSAVYRARDRTTGGEVALKVVADPTDAARLRLSNEARLLAEIDDPGVVRYVAHGTTDGGDLYLATEWVEGEALAERLAREGALPVDGAVDLARRAAGALAVVHVRGVVHRDVTPANVLVASGGDVKIVDFGIARTAGSGGERPAAQQIVGTPGYMAPEQARGASDVDARADVFALGCVLFECLTGRAAFAGQDARAALARALFDEAPRVCEVRAAVPDAIDDLVARMLQKDPERRPSDARAVARELDAVLAAMHSPAIAAPRRPSRPAALTAGEQRILCVVLAAAEGDDLDRLARARAALGPMTAIVESLADGSIVAVLRGHASATEQAVLAARAALALRAAMPGVPIALATGRGVLAGSWPAGEAIDRAARLSRGAGDAIRLDDVTAGLLDARFDVQRDAGADPLLRGERAVAEGKRTLLGRSTSFVGRDAELARISGIFRECAARRAAAAVIVTAEAGVGKSRLRHELVRQIAASGEPAEILIGHGDPLRAGSPFAVIAPLVRRAAGLADGEPADAQRRKLVARVARHVDAAQVTRVAEFLGEMAGVAFPDGGDDRVQLHAARRDPRLMGDQVMRAWEDFLAAECAAKPVLLVLEDMHWGDGPSAALVDGALRALADRPLMALALARPEVSEVLPRLWADRALTEIPLGPLAPDVSARLVRELLGDGVAGETVAGVVERAAGNAFFLEELIRAVAEGKGEALPGSVVATLQSRFEALGAPARHVLRAASVLGEVFWKDAVEALLGDRAMDVDGALEDLEARELVARRGAGKFPGEYRFRHALVRDAASAMLTDADRVLGHRLAGAWLESAGERDPIVLAEHFDRGGEPARAAAWHLRAAEGALAANDYRCAIDRADRGLACAAASQAAQPPVGALRLVQATAHRWRGDMADATRRGLEAMRALGRGSAHWFAAVGEVIESLGRRSEYDQVAAFTAEAREVPARDAEALRAKIGALLPAATRLHEGGHAALSEETLAEVHGLAERVTPRDPLLEGHVRRLMARRLFLDQDMEGFVREGVAAVAALQLAGDVRLACTERVYIGYGLQELGDYERAQAALREAFAAAERLGVPVDALRASHNLGWVMSRLDAGEEAWAVEQRALDLAVSLGNERYQCAARHYMSAMALDRGDAGRAEQEARASLRLEPEVPAARAIGLALLACALLAQRRAGEAMECAREAFGILAPLGTIEVGESLVRRAYAEALRAVGDHAAAREAIASARDSLLARAAKIGDEALRRSFLERVPDNARTCSLARAWLEHDETPIASSMESVR